MNTRFARFLPAITVFSLSVLLIGGFNLSAATLTVSPSVISNTYPGNITLTIGGLTNSQPVTVQKWLDLNANGAIDAGEPMMDAFNIAESGAMVISGITNICVPFDSNSATDTITTVLNFAPPMTLENIVGHMIYRVVSPTAAFAPVTATFTVTNAATAQSLTGTIYSNGVTPVPYAIVAAIPNNGYAGAAVADVNGHYSLNLDPGTYSLIGTAPNYYCDQSLAPTVTLTNGLVSTNNLSLTNGTATISGNIYNSANSNGVGGLMFQLQSGSGNSDGGGGGGNKGPSLFEIAFTDTNGNYSAAVSSDYWSIKLAKERLSRRAFVAPQNALQVNATAGNVTNANIAVFKGTALYYGRLTDSNGKPFPNIRVDSNDGSNNLYGAVGYTDTNGYYAVVGLGGISSDWNCQANDSDNPVLASYIVNSPTNMSLSVGQTVLQNFLALPVTAHITGQVRDNLGNVVSGVAMFAATFLGGNSYSSQNINTDNSGNYSLGVASGTWGVNFSYGGKSGLDRAGYIDYFGPYLVGIPPTNVVLNITVYPNGTPVMSLPQQTSPGQFGFYINGSVNNSYDVQVSTNLASTNWVRLFSLTLTNSPFPVTDSHATNSQRFYRIKKN
ncbi:MAG: carboxypeptidase regulatory-like domain-containing protein [Verrucomicrobiae bacterium]|nr:carboxypeptidase regulatory-like domain-containing protein [Verrucomicrobiae bacterium]